MLLSLWLEKWLATYAPVRCHSAKTIERYHEIARYLSSTPELMAAANTPIEELKPAVLESGILSLLCAPAIRRDHLSPTTVRHFGQLLDVALTKASMLDLIDRNPMDKVELPGLSQRPEARCLTLPEIRKLRDICRGEWTFPFVEIALGTGARRGELLALEWPDVNLKAGILTISKSLDQTKAGLHIKAPKNGHARRCTLPSSTVTALREAFARSSGLIFGSDSETYRNPALVSQLIVRRLRKAGVRGASLHSLRHTHASNLLSRGISLAAVSRRLGHSSPATTARIYTHRLPPDDRRAAEEWDDLLTARLS